MTTKRERLKRASRDRYRSWLLWFVVFGLVTAFAVICSILTR